MQPALTHTPLLALLLLFLTHHSQFSSPASEAEVSPLLNSLPNNQCELDPIPPSLLKDCASVLAPEITKIINLSLSSGNFPMVFKHSLVTPLLKKANLDKENPSNYRPIS